MKILVIADIESKSLWDNFAPEKFDGIDLIISCGDLCADYLEFIATMVPITILSVPGNHDTKYTETPPGGCECIDGDIYTFRGVRILGLGGSMKYKRGPFMYTEKEMKRKIRRVKRKIIRNSGFDILVTHAPVKDFGDMPDLPHRGFKCFGKLLELCRPSYMIHGHVHANYGSKFARMREHTSGTTIINAYEKYIFEYDETKRVELKRSELFKKLFMKFW